MADKSWMQQRIADLNKNQYELAAALGLSQGQFSQVVRGRRRLRIDELPIIASFLDMKPTDVMIRSLGDGQ